MDSKILDRSNKIKIIAITFLIFLLSVAGVTYAYFAINVTGNDTASSMRLTTADMTLVYTDIQVAFGDDQDPGWTETKTLTVENIGNKTATYNIIWRDLLNEITNNELVISATCVATSGSCPAITETPIPMSLTETHYANVKKGITIAPGVTHTYTVTFTFKETGSNQNYNQDKIFYGTLNIGEVLKIKRNGTDSTTGLPVVKIGPTEEFYDITNAINYTNLINTTGNVYNYASGKSMLLAKYSLLVGDVLDVDLENSRYIYIKTYSLSDEGYGLQSPIARAYSEDIPRVGMVPFSGTNYWDDRICQYTASTWACSGPATHLMSEYALNNASYSGNPYPYIYVPSMSTTNFVNDYTNGGGNAQNNGYTIAYYVEEYVNRLGVNATGRLLSYEETIALADANSSAVYNGTSYWLGSTYSYRFPWMVRYDGVTYNNYNFARSFVCGVRPVIVVNTSDIQSN